MVEVVGMDVVQSHLPDILVPDSADLLDVGGTLRNTFQGVTGELELILDVGRSDDIDTGLGSNTADVLLAEEVPGRKGFQSASRSFFMNQYQYFKRKVLRELELPSPKKVNIRSGVSRIPDLNVELASLGVLLKVDVDGKVCVDVAHLVLEAPGDTNDQVVNDGADSTEGSDTLAGTVVHLDRDHILLGAAEGDGDVRKVLNELAWRKRKSVSVGRLRCGFSWRITVAGEYEC